jgi:O-methyltransferase
MSLFQKMIRKIIPGEVQAPPNVFREVLVRSGYFKLRTKLAAHGMKVPNADLYRPLFSPWEGEPSFEKDYQLIRDHTLCSRDRCYVLKMTLSQALLNEGDVFECGVFRGGTALLEAITLDANSDGRVGKKLHLFDSFRGMPDSAPGIDRIKGGDLGTTSVENVAALLKNFPFAEIHAGFIPQTFSDLQVSKICWAHIDVDIYQSVHDCIDYIYPKLTPGGVMIFDDYGFPSCPGARRAVDEAFASLPEVPLCLPTGQCLVMKLAS